MVLIDSVYELSYAIAAKQSQGFPSPADFNRFCNLANMDLFNFYNDEREKLLLKVNSGEQIFMPTTLNDFIAASTVTSNTGVFPMPTDYQYYLSLNSPSSQADCLKVDQSKLANYLNSTVDNPTIQFPIFTENSDTFNVYPNSINSIIITYIKTPPAVLWAYTVTADNQPIYDPNNSINFIWTDTEIYRLTARVLFYMGVSIRDTELMQEAAQMTNTAS